MARSHTAGAVSRMTDTWIDGAPLHRCPGCGLRMTWAWGPNALGRPPATRDEGGLGRGCGRGRPTPRARRGLARARSRPRSRGPTRGLPRSGARGPACSRSSRHGPIRSPDSGRPAPASNTAARLSRARAPGCGQVGHATSTNHSRTQATMFSVSQASPSTGKGNARTVSRVSYTRCPSRSASRKETRRAPDHRHRGGQRCR